MKVSVRRRKGYAHSLTADHHTLICDEPPTVGGTDTGPRPTQLLALSLAACTAVTIEMYAERKGWDVGDVAIDVDYDIDPGGTSRFDVLVEIPGEVTDEQVEKLKTIAGRCPVHRVLTGSVQISDEVRRA